MTESTESEKELAAEVSAALREKLSQIRGAPGANIGFEVSDHDFTVRVSIEREQRLFSTLSGRRVAV